MKRNIFFTTLLTILYVPAWSAVVAVIPTLLSTLFDRRAVSVAVFSAEFLDIFPFICILMSLFLFADGYYFLWKSLRAKQGTIWFSAYISVFWSWTGYGGWWHRRTILNLK